MVIFSRRYSHPSVICTQTLLFVNLVFCFTSKLLPTYLEKKKKFLKNFQTFFSPLENYLSGPGDFFSGTTAYAASSGDFFPIDFLQEHVFDFFHLLKLT